MNASNLYLPFISVGQLAGSVTQSLRSRTQQAMERLAYGNTLRVMSQQLIECDDCLHDARDILTQVVAEKVRLRSQLSQYTNSNHALQSHYNDLHDVEQRLVHHLRLGMRKLASCREVLHQVRTASFAQRHSHHERMESMYVTLQDIRHQHDALTGQLQAILNRPA